MNTNQDRLYAFRDFTSHLFRLTMTSMKGNQADIQAQFDKVLDKSLEMMETSQQSQHSPTFTETFHTQSNTNANVVVEKANSATMPPRLNIREVGETTLFEPSPSRRYSDMNTMGAPPWAHYLSRQDNTKVGSVEPDVEIGTDDYDVPEAGEEEVEEDVAEEDVAEEDAVEEEEVEEDVAEEDVAEEDVAEEDAVEEEEVEEEVEEEAVEEDAVEEEEAEEEVEEEVEEEEVEEEVEEEEGMEVITVARKKYYCGERTRQVYKYLNDEEAGELLGTFVNGKIVPM